MAPSVTVDGPVVARARQVLLSKPVLAAVTLLALCALPYAIPKLGRLRVFAHPSRTTADQAALAPIDRIGEAKIEMTTEDRPDLAQPEHVEMPKGRKGPIAASGDETPLPDIHAERPPLSIIDDSKSLDSFFSALTETARKRAHAITRIVYYGDSAVASDFATGTLRRKLQADFGDAGHGFVLVANAWPAYFHNDVFRKADKGFLVSRVVGPYQADGLYGLGGVSFVAPPGLRSLVGTAKSGSFGTSVSRFVVSYLEQPLGGELKISLDGHPTDVVDTAGPAPHARFHEMRVPDGPHLFEVLTAKATTRLFGFVLERDAPGVVLDALGVVGARIRFLDKLDDTHWAEQLAFRNPDLVAFQFGANESGDGFAYSMDDYERTMKDVLLQVHRAVPKAGCLIVGAMDRARKDGDRLVTVPVIPFIVERQRKAAHDVGCAFFDTFTAMGGRGSMAHWVYRGLGAGDFTHPTSVGAEVLGNWIYRALMERYAKYRERIAKSGDSPPQK